ncbi:MAG TPA: hypothetical protein PL070_00760, partial [Flavobacteriales bacterium]|nr:hypothetical protein [Flavobacteriales bacterium]
TITVGQLLSVNVAAANTTLCQGQSTQLNATASGGSGLTYSWTGAGLNNSSIPNPIATPTQTTTYTCTVTHTASGCSLNQSVTVIVTTGYTANAGAGGNVSFFQTLCSTLGHQLGVQHNVPNAQYTWTPAVNLNAANIQAPTILVDGTATYTVTITDVNGCSISDQVVITKAFVGVPAQSTASGCINTPPTLNAPATATSYQWSTGQTSQSIIPTSSGPHTVTMTNAQGCEVSTTFSVTLHAS